ncbi:MAG: hypothetical protein KME10_11650 [Plectolyngbya sp. WJT66-NPBG17]|jgi:hypothetical protein|nr:hypothetical protein [Plectolyngbya sp. WJT66-NPBG17]
MVGKIAAGIVIGFIGIVGLISIAQIIGAANSDESGEFGEMARKREAGNIQYQMLLCNKGDKEACDRIPKKD